ncbi:MAG TPA: hypothetical protein VFY36_04480 [Solirubrobacteraceae bacterium]|nr:hypothetical protein [Solirubrobacteraceae bacterium]
MKRAIFTCLLFLTLAMSTASAGAHEFLASSTGKLTSKLLTTVVLKNIAGNMECKGASLAEGAVATTKSTFLVSTVQFEKCTAFGLLMTMSPARIRSTADGSVSLLKTVTTKAISCQVTIPSNKNQNLNTVKYRNTNKQIEKLATVSKITSVGIGAACAYAEESTGVLTGNALVGLIGGAIDWQ